jgi:hypothetical protein
MGKNNSKLIGEELIGAEILASRELAESAGSLWDTLERSGRIQQQQFSLLCKDYAQYAGEVTNPFAIPQATVRLLQRRVTHVGDGWRAFGKLLQDEYAPIGRAWSSFFDVVKKDWRR